MARKPRDKIAPAADIEGDRSKVGQERAGIPQDTRKGITAPANIDLQSGAADLVSQEEVAAKETSRQRTDGVRKGDGFLIHQQLLKGEGHSGIRTARE